jgi:IS5 family transposase
MPRTSAQALAKKKVADRESQRERYAERKAAIAKKKEKKKQYNMTQRKKEKEMKTEATDNVGALPSFGDAGTFDSPNQRTKRVEQPLKPLMSLRL